MDEYTINYSCGGTEGHEKANSHKDAIIKNASKSLPKVCCRFFETYPQIEPKHFIVTNTKTNEKKYFKMIIES